MSSRTLVRVKTREQIARSVRSGCVERLPTAVEMAGVVLARLVRGRMGLYGCPVDLRVSHRRCSGCRSDGGRPHGARGPCSPVDRLVGRPLLAPRGAAPHHARADGGTGRHGHGGGCRRWTRAGSRVGRARDGVIDRPQAGSGRPAPAPREYSAPAGGDERPVEHDLKRRVRARGAVGRPVDERHGASDSVQRDRRRLRGQRPRAVHRSARPSPAAPYERRSAASRELLLGVREIACTAALRRLVGLLAVLTFAEGAIDVLVVVVALRLLDTGDAGVGWLNAGWGLGGVFGGAVALVLLERRRLAVGLASGASLVSLALLGIGTEPSLAFAVLSLTAVGIGYSLVEVAGLTLLQRLVSDEVLARAFAVVESSYWLATGAGAVAAPGLVALLGIRGALVAVAALVFIVAANWHAVADLEVGASVPERTFGLLRTASINASAAGCCRNARVTLGAGSASAG